MYAKRCRAEEFEILSNFLYAERKRQDDLGILTDALYDAKVNEFISEYFGGTVKTVDDRDKIGV